MAVCKFVKCCGFLSKKYNFMQLVCESECQNYYWCIMLSEAHAHVLLQEYASDENSWHF